MNEKNEFEEAAEAALKHAGNLPPSIARSQAFREAGKLRSAADRLQPPKFPPPVDGLNDRRPANHDLT